MRDGPWKNQKDSPCWFPDDEMLVQQNREKDAEPDVKDNVDNGPDDRLQKNIPEQRIRQNRRVLLKTDDLPITKMVDIRVGEGERDVVEERIRDDGQDDNDRWTDEER